MLTATDARNATVQGTLRNPSTKRSEVVNPTSKKPPTISHSQGMDILSLDERRPLVTLTRHDEAAHHRQHDRASALPRIHWDPAARNSGRRLVDGQLVARNDGGFRRCSTGVPHLLRSAAEHARGSRDP